MGERAVAVSEKRAIWKFTLTPGQPVMMPAGKVLSAHGQHDKICVWAEVDPSTPLRPRHFNVYGTGHTLPEMPGYFLGTALIDGGNLVFHVYEAAP